MKRIRDPIYGYIALGDDELKIVDSPFFQRLRYIRQNGLAYLVFPSATHSRFEHSLGTFHVASMMVERVKASIDKPLVKKVALVHDIGHLPFSHTFEDALKILDAMGKKENNTDFKTAKPHEYMGIHILKDCMGFDDLAKAMEDIYVKKSLKVESSIVSSTLDADRLDYLQRDSYYFGVKYGLIPLDRLLEVMEINENGKYIFNSKGRDDLEHFLIARYHMYSAVYNHPVKGIMDGIMAYTIAKMIHDNIITKEEMEDCEKLVNFTDDAVIFKLKSVSSDNKYRHLYEALYMRKKYKKIILEGQKADTFKSLYETKELYDFVIQTEGKLVIADFTTEMPVQNIVLKMGKDIIDLDKVKSINYYINVPEPRLKIAIGYSDDSVYEEFKKRFPIE